MQYQEFKETIIEELKQYYGKDAVIEVKQIVKNHNQYYDGLQILLRKEEKVSPIIYLNEMYEKFCKENMKVSQCVEWILEVRNQREQQQLIYEFAKQLREWNQIKEQIYPTLVSVKSNEAYVNQFVSTPFLDMAVIYRISYFNQDGSSYSVKITQAMLESYGITVEQLHEQAISNLEKDSYQFQSIEDCVKGMMPFMDIQDSEVFIDSCTGLYIIHNKSRMYGASAVLNKQLIKKLVGNKNYYIILSCIHEVVLIVDHDDMNREAINKIITEVMDTAIAKEDQLMNHYYYYHGKTGEISMEE